MPIDEHFPLSRFERVFWVEVRPKTVSFKIDDNTSFTIALAPCAMVSHAQNEADMKLSEEVMRLMACGLALKFE
jgi:hypothetical protein